MISSNFSAKYSKSKEIVKKLRGFSKNLRRLSSRFGEKASFPLAKTRTFFEKKRVFIKFLEKFQ